MDIAKLSENEDMAKFTMMYDGLHCSEYGHSKYLEWISEALLQSIEALRELTESQLKEHNENQDVRIRSYQTLGLCAGAAIAILFI